MLLPRPPRDHIATSQSGNKKPQIKNHKRPTELADDQTPSKALGIMLYGWKNKRRFGQSYRNALKHRDWMYITEVMDLSAYVGADLTKK